MLDIVKRWDSLFASFFAVLVILMTTISTNATGNIIPAGYQIAAIAPTKLTYKNGVLDCQYYQLADLPVEINGKSEHSVYSFLDIIGGMLGPVIGVMMAHYFVVMRGQKLILMNCIPHLAIINITITVLTSLRFQ